MNEKQAIQAALDELHNAVVVTGGYDEDALDYLAAMEDDGPEVYVEAGTYPLGLDGPDVVPAIILRRIDEDGYIESGEPLAVVLAVDDYDMLKRTEST